MKRKLLLVVALGVFALTGLTVSREEFNALLDSLVPSSVDLAVEVKPLRNEPNSKYGNITITNLSEETVTIKHVSINRSSDAACACASTLAVALQTETLPKQIGLPISFRSSTDVRTIQNVLAPLKDLDHESAYHDDDESEKYDCFDDHFSDPAMSGS
jgi:hypothetical protein